jgi:hypothetical protein
MKVTVSLSRQQLNLLLAVLAERVHPVPALEQLIANAFDEHCRTHAAEPGDPERAG